MNFTRIIRVEEMSQAGEVRRLAATVCDTLGFDETRAGRAVIAATELATNLVKHAGGGEIVLAAWCADGAGTLDILALDRGPGIANIGECLRDGYSTAGSPGTGLGAVQRQSTLFDLSSTPGRGTAVLSRHSTVLPAPALVVDAVRLPCPGEEVCGDAWAVKRLRGTTLFLIADGLGHGPDAAAAANHAVALFDLHAPAPPAALVAALHAGLYATRGAAVAVAEIALGQRLVRYAGVGNICARIESATGSRGLFSNNGTAGLKAGKIQEFTYPWPDDGLLVLHTDGVATHWNLTDTPGLARKTPALIAGVLLRDHRRPRDDSTVVVARETAGPGRAAP